MVLRELMVSKACGRVEAVVNEAAIQPSIVAIVSIGIYFFVSFLIVETEPVL